MDTVPTDYDWEGTRAISGVHTTASEKGSERSSVDEKDEVDDTKEMTKDFVEAVDYQMTAESAAALDRNELQRVFKRASWISLLLTFIITIVRSFPARCAAQN